MKKALILACVAVVLGSLPVSAQVDLSVYVALGDSLTAGFASGGLMDYYQQRSYPAMLAQQGGTTPFALPLISPPGINPLLELRAIAPSIVLAPSGPDPGAPYNFEYPAPYNNLGVPGASLHDMIFTTGDITNLLTGASTSATVMYDIILRNGVNSALEQAIGLQPTFVTVWIGNNDILAAAVAGTPIEGITMTPVDLFAAEYTTAIGGLRQNAPGADIVVFTLPDVAAIPFVTTLDPYIDVPGVGRVPLIGSNGPLPEDAYVTLAASAYLAAGIGIPAQLGGTGLPLPEDINVLTGEYGVVLRAEEVAVISQRVNELNAVIEATAAAFDIPVLDVNGIFNEIVFGDGPEFGGIGINGDFLTGGIFSFDGIHPQQIGQGLVAMHLIDLINDHFNAGIQQVDMFEIMCENGCDAGFKAQYDELPVFTAEAFDQLKQLFPVNLPQQPTRTRRAIDRH